MKLKSYLIIYILLSQWSYSQSISIKYSAKTEAEMTVIDSINSRVKFNNYNELKSSNDSLIGRLQKTGYLNLLAQSILKYNDSTYKQKISLGNKYKTIRIIASSKNPVLDSLIEITLSRKRNKNYTTPQQLDLKTKEIYSYLLNNGYPFTSLKKQIIYLKNKDTINVKLTIDLNEKRYINNIVIKGYEEFPKNYIKNIVHKKYPINDKNMDRIKNKFTSMPFVEIVKEPELLFKKDSTLLYVYLKKKSTNLLDGLIGFNNNDGSQLEINGYLDLQLNNNLNNGESMHIIYRGDDKDQTQLDVNLNLPYILKSNIGINAGFNLLRRDSTYQNSSFNTGIFYSFNPQTRSGVSYTSTRSTATNSTLTNTAFQKQNININLEHVKNSTDILTIYEQKAQLTISGGVRSTAIKKTDQVTIHTQLEKNIKLSDQHSIYIDGKLLLLGSNDVLFNELFQVGGINSIRGFNQNSIDTSFFTAINTEYRFRISRGIYLHSILDYGIFEDFNTEETQKIYGLGLGTAILTQSGILRISIANGAFSGANLDFSSTVAHINLKIRF